MTRMTNFQYDVRICPENMDRIGLDIRAIEKGSTVFTVTADMVTEIIETLVKSVFSSHENLIGGTVDVDYHANDVAAQRMQPWESTQLTLLYAQDGWHLVNIRRATIGMATNRYKLNLSDEARKDMIAHLTGESR